MCAKKEVRGCDQKRYDARIVSQSADTIKTPYYMCENIENNLGFEVRNKLEFTSHEEKEKLPGTVLCRYKDACPYYSHLPEGEGRKVTVQMDTILV